MCICGRCSRLFRLVLRHRSFQKIICSSPLSLGPLSVCFHVRSVRGAQMLRHLVFADCTESDAAAGSASVSECKFHFLFCSGLRWQNCAGSAVDAHHPPPHNRTHPRNFVVTALSGINGAQCELDMEGHQILDSGSVHLLLHRLLRSCRPVPQLFAAMRSASQHRHLHTSQFR